MPLNFKKVPFYLIYGKNLLISNAHAVGQKASLFDDKEGELNALCGQVRRALETIAASSAGLASFENDPGLNEDGAAHRRAVTQSIRSLAMARTLAFQTALEQRTKNLHNLEARRKLYGNRRARRAGFGLTDLREGGRDGGARERDDEDETTRGAGRRKSVQIDLEADLESGVSRGGDGGENSGGEGLGIGNRRKQLLLKKRGSSMTSYYQSRLDATDQVQRMLGELGTMFAKVANLVGQQEEQIARIDDAVDTSLHRLREGQQQLLKYFTSVSSRRALILKLLGLILAFSCFFIVFLV